MSKCEARGCLYTCEKNHGRLCVCHIGKVRECVSCEKYFSPSVFRNTDGKQCGRCFTKNTKDFYPDKKEDLERLYVKQQRALALSREEKEEIKKETDILRFEMKQAIANIRKNLEQRDELRASMISSFVNVKSEDNVGVNVERVETKVKNNEREEESEEENDPNNTEVSSDDDDGIDHDEDEYEKDDEEEYVPDDE
jgi:hypothetical protein